MGVGAFCCDFGALRLGVGLGWFAVLWVCVGGGGF